MDIKEKVKEFVTKYIQEDDLGYDVNFFEGGFVNSLFAMQLVMFIEREFEIQVDNSDLNITNFDTINHIVALIEGKKAS
ncbi:MAG: acyl carrier protein [Coprococcus sp.]|nr:acyl carrier protein [Coprococcus sp.]